MVKFIYLLNLKIDIWLQNYHYLVLVYFWRLKNEIIRKKE